MAYKNWQANLLRFQRQLKEPRYKGTEIHDVRQKASATARYMRCETSATAGQMLQPATARERPDRPDPATARNATA